jgi:hypothetical protein
MGVRNLRAICPNCGGKIHTQPKGLGHFSLSSNSWFLVQTGTECQHCGAALSGKVGPGNKAIAAEDADLSLWERTKKEAGMGTPEPSPTAIAPDAIANDPATQQRAAEFERQRLAREGGTPDEMDAELSRRTADWKRTRKRWWQR